MRRRFIIFLLLTLAVVPAFAGGRQEPGALIGPEEAFEMVQAGDAVLVDVRSEVAYLETHLAGAINVPLQQMQGAASQLESRGQTAITYCACPAEETSLAAASQLIAVGFTDVLVLQGGIRDWALLGLPLRSGARP